MSHGVYVRTVFLSQTRWCLWSFSDPAVHSIIHCILGVFEGLMPAASILYVTAVIGIRRRFRRRMIYGISRVCVPHGGVVCTSSNSNGMVSKRVAYGYKKRREI